MQFRLWASTQIPEMNDNSKDQYFLQSLKKIGSHLKSDLDKNIIPRLTELAGKEEVLVMIYLDMELTQGQTAGIKLEQSMLIPEENLIRSQASA